MRHWLISTGPMIIIGALLAAPAAAQTLGQAQELAIPWFRLGVALALCLGLAVAAVVLQRRRLGQPMPRVSEILRSLAAGTASETRITNIETHRLTANVTVSIFRCDGRDYMVTATAQGQLVLVSLVAGQAETHGPS